MPELSPAACAVLGSIVDGAHPAFAPIAAPMAAAALCAAVNQVVPETTTPWNSTLTPIMSTPEVRAKLLAIAAELERF